MLRLHPHQRSSSFESLQIIIAFLKQKRVLLAPPGIMSRITGFYILHLRNFSSHCQSNRGRVPFPQTSLHCCGLLFSSPRLCFSPGWRCPEALFMVFQLDSQGAKVCKSCRSRQELSNGYLLFTCKIWLRYSRGGASESLPKVRKKSEQT